MQQGHQQQLSSHPRGDAHHHDPARGQGVGFGSNYTMSVTASGSYLHYYWNQIATNSQTYSVGGDTNKLTITGLITLMPALTA